MAEEQVGLGKEPGREPAPWTRIFTAFRVAADPKKLLLAAGGIFVMALGWWILATIFYQLNRQPPNWGDYREQVGTDRRFKDEGEAFKSYKQDLNNWNLLHRLAGPVSIPVGDETGEEKVRGVRFTVADFSHTLEQFEAAQKELRLIEDDLNRKERLLEVEKVDDDDTSIAFSLDNFQVRFKSKAGAVDWDKLKDLEGKVRGNTLIKAYSPTTKEAKVEGIVLELADEATGKAEWDKFEGYVTTERKLSDIEYELAEGARQGREEATRIALKVIRLKNDNMYKPAGYLSTWPFFEYRGPNPFLAVTGMTAATLEGRTAAQETAGGILGWLFAEQMPVLLEPLVKFLSPVIYFLHPAGYFWTRVYLLLVILWTIATWSFFGGAITRMAAVQVARPTERVGMGEAIRFAMSRYRSYLASQLLPFAFLAGIAILLLIFGFFEILIPIVGDILIAGLGFPLVILLGLIMAVVLIGLVGWPLMYATISTEGSDSFDAISRSYSYVYQAPWQYIWYGFLALVYGAVLVFFVGVMGSLLVYLGKWGMSLSPVVWADREPTYLFRFAPTSYGWRDLLLHQSPNVKTESILVNTGQVTQTYILDPEYLGRLEFWNTWGSVMVAFWIFLLFLMVIGFGYSFFWSASSIIYLLMRRKVDDTEMDEVHLEEEEIDTPAYQTAAPATAIKEPGTTGGRSAVSLNVVEGPPQAAAPPPSATPATAVPAEPAETPPPTTGNGEPAEETVPAGEETPAPSSGSNDAPEPTLPKTTQLAPGGSLEEEEKKNEESDEEKSS